MRYTLLLSLSVLLCSFVAHGQAASADLAPPPPEPIQIPKSAINVTSNGTPHLNTWTADRVNDGSLDQDAEACQCCTALVRPSWVQLSLNKTYIVERVLVLGRYDWALDQFGNITMSMGLKTDSLQDEQFTINNETVAEKRLTPPREIQFVRVTGSDNGYYMTICEILIYRQAEKAFNSTCTTDVECKTNGSKCLNQKCACAATNFHDSETDSCVQKKVFNSACTGNQECKTNGSKCLYQRCTCETSSSHDSKADKCLPNVDIATSQNDVRFVNIEGLRNIRINIQLADNQSVAYIRLYINDTTENQATIIVGPSQVDVMSCNSTDCAHLTISTTEPNHHLLQVGENYSLELNSTATIPLQSGRFTKLALMSLTGKASFKNVPHTESIPQFVNNSKEQIELINVTFPLTTPPINQPEGSPPPTAPLDEYPGLAPLVPKYSNSLSKAMPRSHDERSLSKRSTSAASSGGNSSSEEQCLTDCYCPCGWVEEPKHFTQNEIASMVAAIQERLKVDLKKLTSTQRKLNSAPDNRPSAKAVGVVGMIFLVLTLGAIVVVDIGNIIRDLKTLCNNLRQGFGCREASSKPSTVASPHDTVEQSTSV